jgi:hypothetical protein
MERHVLDSSGMVFLRDCVSGQDRKKKVLRGQGENGPNKVSYDFILRINDVARDLVETVMYYVVEPAGGVRTRD